MDNISNFEQKQKQKNKSQISETSTIPPITNSNNWKEDTINSEHLEISELRGNYLDSEIDTFVIIDIETTGLAYKDSIIEIAAIKVIKNKVVDTFSTLISPKDEIPTHITAMTGISNDMVVNAPQFTEIAESFLNFVSDDIIVGHNVIFDIDRINNKLCEHNYKYLKNNYIDTMILSKKIINDVGNYQLQTIAEYFNVVPDKKHRALDDCFTTLHCYEELCKNSTYTDDDLLSIKSSDDILQCYNKITHHSVDFKNQKYKIVGQFSEIDNFLIYEVLSKLGAEETARYDKCDIFYLSKTSYIRYKKGENSVKLCGVREEENLGKKVLSEYDLYSMLGISCATYNFENKLSSFSQKNIESDDSNFNPDSKLSGKTIVITGELDCISRREVYQRIKNAGGLCGDNVTKSTNYLVTNSDAQTGKMKKALRYMEQGQDIKIINEQELYELLKM